MRDIELNCIFLAEKRRYLPYFWMIPLWIRYTSLNMEGHEDYVSLTNQILSDECRISKCFKHKNICNYNYCHFRCLNYPSVYPRRSIYLIIYLYICIFYLSIYLVIHLSIYLSYLIIDSFFYLSKYSSNHLTIHLSVLFLSYHAVIGLIIF